MLGFKVSLMVTVKKQLSLLPATSVAMNLLMVVPTGNIEPEANPNVCTVETTPEQLSVPIGVL